MFIKPIIFCLGIFPAVALADDFYISSQSGNHLSLFDSK
ncbi:MAG TPA: YncE family protein, partial [Methylophaga sp.]|nr:YncE family protein [Methylophaga sp.]